MEELTLESLARRVEALERAQAAKPQPARDWRSAVGMFDEDTEFMPRMLAEVAAAREAEREAARAEAGK